MVIGLLISNLKGRTLSSVNFVSFKKKKKKSMPLPSLLLGLRQYAAHLLAQWAAFWYYSRPILMSWPPASVSQALGAQRWPSFVPFSVSFAIKFVYLRRRRKRYSATSSLFGLAISTKKKKVFLKNNDLRCEEMWFLFFTIKWLDNIGLKLLFMVQIIKKDLIILLRLSSLTPFSKKKNK